MVGFRPAVWGVRGRACLAAVAVMAVALAVVAAALLGLLKTSLDSSADASTAARAEQITAQLRSDALSGQDGSLLAAAGDSGVVQILDTAGRVVLASPAAPQVALSAPLGDGQRAHRGAVAVPGTAAVFRVSAQGVAGPDGPHTAVVAVSNTSITDTVGTVAALLALGLPVIVVIVGVATYGLVGRSLGPVERMRARVEQISTADLAERLPVPRPRDEITRLAVTLNAMLARLQAGQQAQRRFVGDASHELRSPLATLTAALELAGDRPEVIDRDMVRAHLLPEALRMQRLVEDLLLLARADEHHLPLREADVDVDDLVADEAAWLRATTELQVVATIAPARVRGDPAQLARVARNLTANAARHARTRIDLACQPTAHAALLVISDDGPGIPVDQRQRVLERFVRLDAGRARGAGGSGLGLAIAAEIVTAHHGTLTITESPTGGAQITVSLPNPPPAPPASTGRPAASQRPAWPGQSASARNR